MNNEKILEQFQLLNETFTALLEQLNEGIESSEGEKLAQVLTPFADHNRKLIDSIQIDPKLS